MVNSRQKGKLGEAKVKEFLEKGSGHIFEFTPGSGNGKIKGDLYIPKVNNRFCIEVKNHAESPFCDKVLTNRSNPFVTWWNKLKKECGSMQPLLFFKYNRSKLFVATDMKPVNVEKYIDIPWLKCYIMLSDEWIGKEKIEWLGSRTT